MHRLTPFAVPLLLALGAPRAHVATPTGTIVASNMMDNTATIVDAASGRVLATLPTGEGPHEVAISHDGKWAVVSNYGVKGKPGHTLTVIDVARREVARTIDLVIHQRPHGMAFFPGDTMLAVTSEASQAVLVVDFRDGHVARVLPTKGRASHMVAMPAAGTPIFTTNIVDGTITQIDVARGEPVRVVPVAKMVEGITITPDARAVLVGSNADSIVVVVDVSKGQAIDTLRGFGLPYRMAVTPNGKMAVISDPVRATISIYDLPGRRRRRVIDVPHDSLVATAEVKDSPSPEGVTVSRDSRWAFVTIQGRNRLAMVDLERGVIVRYAPTGQWSDGIGWSPLVPR